MRWLTALAVCLLASGLPRFLVLCDHGDGDRHVEFVHAEGDCCDLPPDRQEWQAGAREPGEGGGDRSRLVPWHSCEHVSFACDSQSEPRATPKPPRPEPCADHVAAPTTRCPGAAPPTELPPSTGPPPGPPPRSDARTARLGTTLLLI